MATPPLLVLSTYVDIEKVKAGERMSGQAAYNASMGMAGVITFNPIYGLSTYLNDKLYNGHPGQRKIDKFLNFIISLGPNPYD